MDNSTHHPTQHRHGISRPKTTVAGRQTTVAPFARALSVLAAFTPNRRWLCNSDLVERTGLPASTVTRMTRTLVSLGYIHCAADSRKFCLGPSSLTLGYRAAADAEIHRNANQRMSHFAELHQVHVNLCSRDRLDLVVIDSCRTSALPESLQISIGSRLGLVSTAVGWALLASLPDAERHYLLQSAEHRPQFEWGRLRRRSSEGIGQVREGGFCVALGQSGQPMTMVAAPIQLPGQAPQAVSCIGPATLMGRARSVRELGPALVRMAQEIRLSQERP